jgi:hypothetical protein
MRVNLTPAPVFIHFIFARTNELIIGASIHVHNSSIFDDVFSYFLTLTVLNISIRIGFVGAKQKRESVRESA